MQPFDLLTEEDKKIIKEYSRAYGKVEIQDIEKTLYQWNKNKRTLFKALGNQLRVSIPFSQEMKKEVFAAKLIQTYDAYPIPCTLEDLNYLNENKSKFMSDLLEYIKYLCQNQIIGLGSIKNFFHMFSYTLVEQGRTDKDYYFQRLDIKKELKIPKGMKIIKAIQKLLIFYEYPRGELFEQWRNAISNIQTAKEIHQNLIISIHPLDYMTMSDNNCSWSSCMSWIKEGSYSLGTIEMMNSNIAAVAYLESSTPFKFKEYTIPNKSWRMLLLVHKYIIVTGKAYPYNNKETAIAAMTFMRSLLFKNLHWKYQYLNQEYGDLKHWDSNGFLKDESLWYIKYYDRNYKGHKKHAIWFYGNAMYNDMISDHKTTYWCCRNYVEKTLRINISGPATCMCCGEKIEEDVGDVESFEDGTGVKYCEKCMIEYGCADCHSIYPSSSLYDIPLQDKQYTREVCQKCLMDKYLYDDKENTFLSKNYFSHPEKYEMTVFFSKDMSCLYDDMQKFLINHMILAENVSAKITKYKTLEDFPGENDKYYLFQIATTNITNLLKENILEIKNVYFLNGHFCFFYAFNNQISLLKAQHIADGNRLYAQEVTEENANEIISAFLVKR